MVIKKLIVMIVLTGIAEVQAADASLIEEHVYEVYADDVVRTYHSPAVSLYDVEKIG